MNELTAIVELAINPCRGAKSEPKVVQFEMDQAQAAVIKAQIDEIQAALSRVTS